MSLVGLSAPDFELTDQHGAAVRLSALRDKPVVVVFFPFAFTGTCTGELTAVRDELIPRFAGQAHVMAISCDSKFALRVFGETHDLEFPMVSDYWPHGDVAKSYGVFDEDRGCARRGTFVIDTDGIVRWSVINAIPDARDVADYRRVLDELTASAA